MKEKGVEVVQNDPEAAHAALLALTAYVWHLLTTNKEHNVKQTGSYTFPDGETWTIEEYKEWRRLE